MKDWRDSKNRRWFGLLGLLNRGLRRFGWVLAYQLDDGTGAHVRWQWRRWDRAANRAR